MAAIRNKPTFGRRSAQRGVAAIFAAIALIALLAAVGLAIDLSRFYFEQRNLQRMANVAALDAARVAGGCMGVPANPDAAALLEVNQSVLRNGGKPDDVGRGSVLVGRMLRDDSSGLRSFATGDTDEKSRAVEVILRRDAPGRLIPIPGVTSGSTLTMSATAAAQSRPLVTIDVGTSVASINQGLLNVLLAGGPLNSIGVVSYKGLLAETVALSQLANGVPIDQFLNTPISVSSLLSNLLNAVGGVVAGVTEPLSQAITAANGSGVTVIPGDVINIPQGYADVADTVRISAGQLLLSVSQLSASNSAVHIPVTLPLGPLASIFLDARLIQPSVPAIIPAGLLSTSSDDNSFARNSQGLVQLSTSLLGGTVNLNLFVQAARATAGLEDIHCARRGQQKHDIEVSAHTDLARIGIGKFDDINAANPQPQPISLVTLKGLMIPPLNILPIGDLNISAYGYIEVGQQKSVSLNFSGPAFPTAPQTINVSTGDIVGSLGHLVSNTQLQFTPCIPNDVPGSRLCLAVSGLPGALNGILGLLTPVINIALAPTLGAILTALSPALNSLVTPLLDVLGLSLGSADVTVVDVTNDQPYLFVKSK